MKSTIEINIDAENQNTPIIEIIRHQTASIGDVLLNQFFEALETKSSWVKIRNMGERVDPNGERMTIYHLVPLSPGDLENTVVEITEVLSKKKYVPIPF